jgi:hypothetical protein
MSSIIFEGNTYTFGATVSANSGTGTTSYIFTSLTPGSTYGFIIWAFNGFGSSSITGPVTKITLSDETRPVIYIFSEYWPSTYVTGGSEIIYSNYSTESLTNLLMPSQAPIKLIYDTIWDQVNNSSLFVSKGITSPIGDTTASLQWLKPFTTGVSFPQTLTGSDTKGYAKTRIGVTSGSTYTFSFYLNYDLGSAPLILGNCAGWTNSNHIKMDWRGATSPTAFFGTSIATTQILPVSTNNSGLSLGVGLTSWQRLAYNLYFPPGISYALGYFLLSDSSASSQIKATGHTFAIWGLQLEIGTGPSTYSPNILDSYNYETTQSHDNLFWNFTPQQGMTYIWPQVLTQVYKFDGSRPTKDNAVELGGVFWNNYDINQDQVMSNNVKLLKGLPSNRKSIRPYGYDIFPFDSFVEDRLGTGTTGMKGTWKFYSNNFSLTGTTGYYPSLWPVAGISAGLSAFTQFFSYLGNTLSELNYILSDREGVVFDFLPVAPSNNFAVDPIHFQNTIKSDARYYQSWYGLSAISEMIIESGITLDSNFTDLYFSKVGYAWQAISHSYAARAANQFLKPSLQQYYPNAYFADYGEFYSDKNYFDGPGTGPSFLRREPVTNSSAPVLYATNSVNGISLWAIDTRYTDEYQRYILDPAQTNKLLISENYDITPPWYKGDATGITTFRSGTSLLNKGIQDPLDTFRSYNLIDGATTNSSSMLDHYISYDTGYVGNNYNIAGSTSHTLSTYFKSGLTNGATWGVMTWVHGGGSRLFAGTVVFDIKGGTVANSKVGFNLSGGSYSWGITLAGNSWYRCWMNIQGYTASSYELSLYLGHSNTASPTYETTGAAYQRVMYGNSGGRELYIWGSQLETGVTEPTEYSARGGSFSTDASINLPNDGWLAFSTEIQNLRGIKRASPTTPIIPWIGNVSWPGDNLVGQTVTRPNIGWSDTKQGYNPKQGCTFTIAGGNSAYYYEFIRHLLLHGIPSISLWPGTVFSYENLSNQSYFDAGYTTYIQEYKDLDSVIHDVNDKIKGFTLTTAETSRIDYLAKYVASGAPGPKGITWWWRITVGVSGSRVLVNGITLDSLNGPYGTWISTTGPTLAHVPITIL